MESPLFKSNAATASDGSRRNERSLHSQFHALELWKQQHDVVGFTEFCKITWLRDDSTWPPLARGLG